MKDLKYIQSFNEHQENLNSEPRELGISDVRSGKKLNEGKNSFDYEWGEGVYIGGSLSFKIYLDKKTNKIIYQYPGKGWGSDVEGVMSNDDIDDLINILQKYKGVY
jgi:hypothetical protein